jgi:hypothetical protein
LATAEMVVPPADPKQHPPLVAIATYYVV